MRPAEGKVRESGLQRAVVACDESTSPCRHRQDQGCQRVQQGGKCDCQAAEWLGGQVRAARGDVGGRLPLAGGSEVYLELRGVSGLSLATSERYALRVTPWWIRFVGSSLLV